MLQDSPVLYKINIPLTMIWRNRHPLNAFRGERIQRFRRTVPDDRVRLSSLLEHTV